LFVFGNTGFRTQGLALARQVLYHLSHTPSLEVDFYNKVKGEEAEKEERWEVRNTAYDWCEVVCLEVETDSRKVGS
jgi:hypothetical protein